MSTLDVWYSNMTAEDILTWMNTEVRERRLGKTEAREATEDVGQARTRDSARVFAKRTGWSRTSCRSSPIRRWSSRSKT